MPTNLCFEEDATEQFIARYRPFVTAVLSGFDRLVFRGTMLPLVIQLSFLHIIFGDSGMCGTFAINLDRIA